MKTYDNDFYRINLKYITDYEKFYNTYDYNELDFSLINSIDIEELKKQADILNNEVCAKLIVYEKNNLTSNSCKEKIRLSKTMGRLILNPKRYNANTKTEAMLLYILCVDPNFLAISLFNIYKNDMEELKKEIINQFGIYDDNIINIILYENKFLKAMNPMMQQQIKLESKKELKKVLKK